MFFLLSDDFFFIGKTMHFLKMENIGLICDLDTLKRTEHLVLSHIILKRCSSSSSVTSFYQIMYCCMVQCRAWGKHTEPH